MKHIFVSLILILSVNLVGWTQSGNSSLSNSLAVNPDNLIMSIINDTYDCRFDIALDKANELIRTMPRDPEGYFYKGGIYKKMLEEGCLASNDSTKRVIRLLVDEACQLAERNLNSYPNNTVAHFYYAASLVYRAWYEAMNHDWFAVMSDGIKARKTLEKAIEIDPNYFDAYAGIGAFNCYAARIPWYLKPLALVVGVNGDEEKGIAQLKKASEFGKYARTEATLFLGSVVYMNREDYSSAAKLMLELHRKFPGNFYFTQYLCQDYYELQNYTQAINLADTVLAVTDPAGSCQRERLSYIQFFRGKSYERIGDTGKAIADYEVIVKLNGNHYAGKDAETALNKLGSQ